MYAQEDTCLGAEGTCVHPLNVRDQHIVCSSYAPQIISWSHYMLSVCCCLLPLPSGESLLAQLSLVDLQQFANSQ